MEQEQIRSLLDSSVEAVNYIQVTLERGRSDLLVAELLENLRQIAILLEMETQDSTGLLQHVHLYCKNLQASLDEIQQEITPFKRGFSLEIRPFVLEMKRIWEIVTDVLLNPRGRDAHRCRLLEDMKLLHGDILGEYRYDVSIVLIAYNKLEYTKKAVESIFEYTDFSMGKVELITVNNGSDDGTREYFESLPHTKKINLKYNVLGTYSVLHIFEGKYIVGFSNDVVATPHWLEHLLTCVSSDPKIAFAVPTCNEEGVSNFQGIPVSYPNTFEGLEQMQEFARQYNCLNPALWEERSQLMPFLSITRSDLYRRGLFDPIYTRVEFVDDDVSTLLRRTGWHQILLKDTFLHHFGGVTLNEGRRNVRDNALDEMRRVYYEKWGVDAWNSRGGFPEADHCFAWRGMHAKDHVLMLEPRFGDFACVIRNNYRQSGLPVHMIAAVFDTRYAEDTSVFFDETFIAHCIEDIANQEIQYHLISAGCYIDELPIDDVIGLLETLYGLLAPGGMLLLPVRNCSSAFELWNLMHGAAWEPYGDVHEVTKFTGIHMQKLLAVLDQHPMLHNYRVQYVNYAIDAPLVQALTKIFEKTFAVKDGVISNLAIRMGFLGILQTPLGTEKEGGL